MPRDPLAWQPLMRHWSRCLGEGGSAVAQLGDLEMVDGLNLAELLPGGPGWADLQRCLRHDPEGSFRILYYGLALRGLEALPAPELLVRPESEEGPRISVLIPVHNHWPITLNALRSLVVMANNTSFEVILADDASSDATTQLGQQLPWLRVWRSEQNQGFLDTCNTAATLARGEILLLLNNDVLVGDHCLDRLSATFDRHPEAGVVGAASWGADGRPLEVGGIIWADGEVWNHGRGFPPEHWFALDYERQTDYVSGCALAIRLQLWQELEGFDPRYRPAYCEDTDLCLRVWEAGYTVLVEPQARIVHLEGLSHSRQTSEGLKAYQLNNLQLLRKRWQIRLDTQQPPGGMASLLAADRRLLGRPLVLLPEPSLETITRCRQLGYEPLALGKTPQPDVINAPSTWQGLEFWLLQQLPLEGGPPVFVLGDPEQPLVQRLTNTGSHWQNLRHTSELKPQPSQPRLPALPGWDRPDLRLLASSTGLHPDGWLETSSRLVIQLLGESLQVVCLRLGLYLPEPGKEQIVQLKLNGGSDGHCCILRPGLTEVQVMLPHPEQHEWVLTVEGSPLPLAGRHGEQRELLAVLSGITTECVTRCA